MRIGIDASRATVARRTGTEGYALNLIRELIALADADDLTLYFRDSPPPGLFSSSSRLALRVMPFPRLWTHVRLSWEMLRRSPDVLFVPAHSLPLLSPPASVATVHDLGYLHYPGAHPALQRLYLGQSTRFSARRAASVIADSQATKRDLVDHYHIPPEKIRVIYPGRDESLTRVTDAAVLARVRAEHNLPGPYLLHVGTLQARKNLIGLVEAFRQLLNSPQIAQITADESNLRSSARFASADNELTLVLAGRRGWLAEPIVERLKTLGLENRVRLLDYVSDADLPALYSAAEAFVFPSLYEGFGFPPLEAMACGTPVVCSRASSLPEVVGEAARLFDPLDTAELAAAIGELLARPEQREELVQRGFEQIKKFSWKRCGEETIGILREVGRRK